VGTAIAAPVVAMKGAVESKKHLNSYLLSECDTRLAKAMSRMAAQQHFHDLLLASAGEQCKGRLVRLEARQGANSNWRTPDLLLQARVEELRLERTGSSDKSYRLRIKSRVRLVRIADGAVLYDQPAEFCSGKGLFYDWTLDNAFQRVAETGYRALAEQCVSRLLRTSDTPIRAGPGYPKAPVPRRSPAASLASSGQSSSRPSLMPVGYWTGDTGTLGIYSTGNVPYVVLQRPLTADQATAEALDDVNHMFQGLVDHPNMMVALPAIAVATPVSLGKQLAAALRGLSPNTLRQADAKLSEAARENRPHEALAAQVAQQLAPQTSEQVILVRQALPPGAQGDVELMHCAARGTLALLTGVQAAGDYLVGQGAETSLEIHVENARLAGKEGINPRLALCVEARATLLRSRDSQQLYSCPVQYRSRARHFKTWAARDAKLFREELQNCYRDISASIVDQLVKRGVVPLSDKPQPVFAQHN